MCNKNMKLYEMQLPIKLANDMDQLSCMLGVTRGEVVARAIQLLSVSVGADKVSLIKNNKTTNVLVK
jgi:hypothetical protein